MEDLGEGVININRMMHKSNNVVSENSGSVVFNGGNPRLGGEHHALGFRQDFDKYNNDVPFNLCFCHFGLNAVAVHFDMPMHIEDGKDDEEEEEPAARRFLDGYYNILDGNHDDRLANLYHEDSVFTIDNETYLGSQNIVARLTTLPFQQYRRIFTSFNCQPCGINGGLLIFVCGNLQIAGRHDALKFSQVFHLMPTLQGSYYVMNDILRVNEA